MTIPSQVTQLLTTLLTGIQTRLPGNLVGLYLRGSLATGDFRIESSDVDLIAVTEREVSDAEFARLVELHSTIAQQAHPFATRIEIAYIDRAAIRRFQPGYRFPTLGQGHGEKLTWTEHHTNWILERWMLREQGIALFGPSPKTLIDPIKPMELSSAVQERLQDWAEWARDLNDPEWQFPRRHKAYIVETMCRALYTLARGEIASKPQSIAWARQNLPEPWRALVEESQSWHTDDTVDPALIPRVHAFVLWAAEQATL
jgi:hypothetical protein